MIGEERKGWGLWVGSGGFDKYDSIVWVGMKRIGLGSGGGIVCIIPVVGD